jgi:septal ring-binding cell division protein DamX
MGPNSFRNLTYLAVLLVVAALIYLVYSSSKNKKGLNPSVENASLGTYTDTLGSIIGSSSAALTIDSVKNSVDGQLLTSGAAGVAATAASTLADVKGSKSEVKEIIAEQPSVGGGDDDGISSSVKGTTTAKGGKKPVAASTVPKKPVAKFDAGNGTGEYMVIAGSFASSDNANLLIAKLKKIGFAKAEAVKLENSANLYVVAGNYEFNGGAEAAVRTLKAEKLDGYVKKRSGEVYKAVAPTVTPKAPAKPASSSKPI